MKRRVGITLRITAAFLGFALGLLLVIGFLAYGNGRSALEAAAISELLTSALEKEAQINKLIDGHEEGVVSIAASPMLLAALQAQRRSPGTASAQAATVQIANELKAHVSGAAGRFVILGIADPETGQFVVGTSPALDGLQVASEPFFVDGKQGYHLAPPALAKIAGGPAMVASTPIRDAHGLVAGVLVAWIDLAGLSNIARQRSGLHRSDDVFLVNPSYQFVTQPRFIDTPAVLRQEVHTEAVQRCLTGNSGVAFSKDYRNVASIVVYRWLPRHKLGLISKIEISEASLLVRDFGEALFIIGLLLLLTSAAGAAVLARTITHPVHALQQAVACFGRGESGVTFPLETRDELGELGREFKRMADAISGNEAQLRANAAQLEQRVRDRTQALQRQADLLDLAHDAIVVLDLHGSIEYWNGGAEEMYGWPQEQALGKDFGGLLNASGATTPAEINEALRVRGRWEGKLAHTRHDGKRIAVASRQAMHFDEHTQSTVTLIINSDITEHSLAEEELNRFFDLSPDLLCIASFDGYFKRVNPAWEKALGYTRAELLGRPYIDFVHPEDRGNTAEEADRQAQGNLTRSFENRYRCKDGSYRWLSWQAVPVVEAATIYAVAHDVTERNRAAQELSRAKDEAEAATRAKSAFLANMSHEIRTPMNGVIGLSALVLKTELTTQQRGYMELVKGSADSLLRLLNDILDFSKIEEGMLKLDAIAFDLRDALGDTLKAFTAAANEKGIEPTYHVAHDVPAWLIGDPGRLGQIIINLTGNALKFTSEGEVVIRVGLAEADRNDGVQLHFSVADTGIGIAPEYQETIFKEFAQADDSTTRRYGGTGLGLAIVTQLVALMDGKIWVVSAPGEGTIFHFTLRLAAAQGAVPALPSPPASGLKDMEVLVVDDNRSNRQILGEILESWNMRPVLAADSDEALKALARANAAQTPFALILLDAQMPRSDGFELAATIRALPGEEKPIIMMLSSNQAEGEMARCAALGVRHFLRKPIKQSELFDAIMLAAGAAPAGVPPSPGRTDTMVAALVRPLKVLVAEDHPVNQTLVSEILRTRGHFFALANNGAEVLALLDDMVFDAILMDGQMPVMDGYEASREIRRREQGSGRHIRIIALTANAMKEDRDLCLAAGMDDYVTKPIDPDQLLTRLEGGSEVAGAALPVAPPEARPASQGLDLHSLQQRARGKAALLRKMVELFLSELPHTLAELDEAASRTDAHALARAAHRLKGAAATLCADALADAAASLEQCARNNETGATAIAKALASVRSRSEALAVELEQMLGEIA